ncbi:Methylenetetrahydrofolate reductase [Seminavis robusta]|uniref:Methylenetetrahydrofolate reductase n=1 Tax=Seminavis robusta TaxID=568900 RepID=A0A9N8HM69_9STRA|nr:Methylenetetrahydrofolate reductase [Seminavis robusta]|eukprot:Sro873_g213990.1 Methylenetetrahydrofolate reductase (688) ;mRNA; f:5419-7645
MTRIIDKILTRRSQKAYKASSEGEDSNKNLDVSDGSNNQFSFKPNYYYSFEFFPPKTEAGLDNLMTRIDRMTRRLEPLFVDVTWGSAGSTSARTLAVASFAQRYCGVDVLCHLTTTRMTQQQLLQALEQAKSCGIRNILALRGDPPKGKRSWKPGDISGGDCDRASDLVKLIKEEYGDWFGIAVAGHPEGHPSSNSTEEELEHLLQKVNAGAEFIITQFFYDVQLFLQFVRRCRAKGITCPILPGIMPIQSYSSFVRMTRYCGISVPPHVMEQLEPVKEDDEAVKEIGCKIAADMCQEILTASIENDEYGIDGLHFYTLNLERSVTRILLRMGAIDLIQPSQVATDTDDPSALQQLTQGLNQAGNNKASPTAANNNHDTIRSSAGRPLPWRPSAMDQRSKEEVRPINWANRPKSYVRRTEDWDEFPNGRWGDATSPAFGELSDLAHFYSFSLGSDDERRAMLGHNPTSEQDVYDVFAKYVEGKLPHIPWCENPLQPESFLIQPQLAKLNRAGFLTINSQPAVDGVESTNPTFGWGGEGGYVYQKAYCECFCSPDNMQRLVQMVRANKAMNLYAIRSNSSSEMVQEGIEVGGVTALTWGVFPNREILQPTIFDPSTFQVWAEEAFSLWTTMWLNLYDFDTESYSLIETIRDTYYLVAIIDNNFLAKNNDGEAGALFSAMFRVGEEMST